MNNRIRSIDMKTTQVNKTNKVNKQVNNTNKINR